MSQFVDLEDVKRLLREYIRKDSRLGQLLSTYRETGQLRTAVSDGTAPIITSSTTVSTNLNADMLDGHHIDDFVLESELTGAIVQEAVEDIVGELAQIAGSGITVAYDDAAGTLTINNDLIIRLGVTSTNSIHTTGSGVFQGDIRANVFYGDGSNLIIDHGALTGLADDDHTQYARADGTRNITGDQIFEQDIFAQGSGVFTGDIRSSGDIHATNIYGSIMTDGSVDHGSLGGLTDDDHTIYSKVDGTRAFTGTVGGVTPLANADLTTKAYVDSLVAASGAVPADHGTLGGLADDDHPQYSRTDGTRAVTGDQSFTQDISVGGSGVFTGDVRTSGSFYGDGSNLTGIVSDHGALTGLADDDHTQYSRTDGTRNITGDQVFEQDVTVQGSGVVTGDIRTSGDIYATNVYGSIVTDGSIDHASLGNLNSATYTHITAANHTDLTDAGDSTLHYHAADRVDANQTFTDVTTNNASTTVHGFLLKATAPAAGLRNIVAIDNTETVYKNTALFDNTNPAASADAASPGTSLIAARRDHVHIGQLTSAQVTDLTDASATTLHKHDHGGMDGLSDDDHTIYAKADGTRAFTGDVTMNQDLIVLGSGMFTGDLRTSGDIYVNDLVVDNAFVISTSGIVSGDMRVGGDIYCDDLICDDLTIDDLSTDNITVGGSGVFTGVIRTEGSIYADGFLGNVVTLTDGATPALNAAQGSIFILSAAGDRTIAVPTNGVNGQKIIIRHYASGGSRTLALNTGAGGFRYGTDITGLSATTSGKTDYIGCIYNEFAGYWDVVAYIKGF